MKFGSVDNRPSDDDPDKAINYVAAEDAQKKELRLRQHLVSHPSTAYASQAEGRIRSSAARPFCMTEQIVVLRCGGWDRQSDTDGHR